MGPCFSTDEETGQVHLPCGTGCSSAGPSGASLPREATGSKPEMASHHILPYTEQSVIFLRPFRVTCAGNQQSHNFPLVPNNIKKKNACVVKKKEKEKRWCVWKQFWRLLDVAGVSDWLSGCHLQDSSLSDSKGLRNQTQDCT